MELKFLSRTERVGFPFLRTSAVGLTTQLMNGMDVPRDAVLTIDFEYLPSLRQDFTSTQALWLDITGLCGESEAIVPQGKTVFSYEDSGVVMHGSGSIMVAGAHLHDGKQCQILVFVPVIGSLTLPRWI